MELLEQRIVRDGTVLDGDILKVNGFLNEQMDPALLMDMGAEIARLFENEGVTKVFTIEASGIALALTAAVHLHVPALFAKKKKAMNQSAEVYSAEIASFTRKNTYEATVSRDFLSASDKVLIVDDFLATGAALEGLISIVNASGASLAGCAVAIEKGFQKGGDVLREKGIRVEALALIDEMSAQGIRYRR